MGRWEEGEERARSERIWEALNLGEGTGMPQANYLKRINPDDQAETIIY